MSEPLWLNNIEMGIQIGKRAHKFVMSAGGVEENQLRLHGRTAQASAGRRGLDADVVLSLDDSAVELLVIALLKDQKPSTITRTFQRLMRIRSAASTTTD